MKSLTANNRGVGRFARAKPSGTHLHRALGNSAIRLLDPFLLLDEFRSDSPDEPLPRFTEHPHRGVETVTYMVAGELEYLDSSGSKGRITAGSIQWLTAGSGIVHSETPRRVGGRMWGFQLWVNLASADKMCAPRCQNIAAESVPEVVQTGVKVHVVAGESQGVKGLATGVNTDPLFLDVSVCANGEYSQSVDSKFNGFVYVIQGEGRFGLDSSREHKLVVRQLGILTHGDTLKMRAGSNGTRFLLVAGRPIREPVAWYGPFVMTSRAEVRQALRDYQAGRLGRCSDARAQGGTTGVPRSRCR